MDFRRPKAEDVRAELIGDLAWVDAVSFGFGHLLPILIHDPTMGKAGLEWGFAAIGNT